MSNLLQKEENKKIVDMHIHTNYSDGEYTPIEIIKMCINNKIGTISITDHDTIDGIKSIDKNNKLIIDNEIKIINGIELSAKTESGRMHILGYGIDINNQELKNKMKILKENSITSLISIIEQIKKDYNIIFKEEELENLINAKHNIGRVDIAKLCIKYGYADSIEDAFDKYLIDAHNKTRNTYKGLPYKECIDLILKSGGIPVLAHPKTLKLQENELKTLIKQMIDDGLKGIEVYHSCHTPEEIELYLQIANKYNLLISGGSDYHGPMIKPNINIGTGVNNNIQIKELSLLEYLYRSKYN